jgi:Tol biopolymer transport system component
VSPWPTGIREVTFTPDGSSIDFVSGGYPLWRVPFLGGTAKKLVDQVNSPVGWSPDGRHMAFLRVLGNYTSDALVIADADGNHERVVAERRPPATLAKYSARPAWSPDGRAVALLGSNLLGGVPTRQLVVVDVETGTERALSLPSFSQYSFIGEASLGLAWLDQAALIVSGGGAAGGPSQLWRLSYPGGQVTRLTNDLSNYSGVTLTADHNSLVTGRSDVRVSVWAGDGSGANLSEVVPPAPGTPFAADLAWAGGRLLFTTTTSTQVVITAVTPGSGAQVEIVKDGRWPAATSDGRTIVFAAIGTPDRAGLWKVDADGRHAVELVSGDVSQPTVTPDDRRVIFGFTRTGLQSPWTVPIDGGTPTELAHVFEYHPDVSPDGKLLVFGATGIRGQLSVCDLPDCK